ncbi:hypothetical protein WA026_015380 [Henosepilachna vigintioctopunctata]|uniref:Sulfotransferase domain-containing protein n=1 Tax=Henosepilachna vigintioctopunctata TaxID=420089 RepID=A0AAW1UL53_9CUCU
MKVNVRTRREMENCKFPVIEKVDEKLNAELLEYFKGETDSYVQVGPKKWFLPVKYKKLAESYKNFQVRPSDVWITGLPRTGTTVTQELVWLLCHNLNYKAAEEDLDERVRYFELDLVFNDKTTEKRIKDFPDDPEHARLTECMRNTLKYLQEDKKRRVMKTHLPFELLPDDILVRGCKVIYVCRHPKDVAVSYHLYERGSWHLNFTGDFQKYWDFFKNGNCTFGPYFEHVKQGYDKKHLNNVLFVYYEDLRKDLKGYIKKISDFLERPVTEKELDKLEQHLRFENFKENPAVSKNLRDADNNEVAFVRKGKVGGWKDYFTVKMNEEADAWIEENMNGMDMRWSQ